MTAVSPLFSVLYLHKTLLVSASVTIDQTVIWNRCKQNKRSKNFDNRLHCRGDFSLGKFNVTLDCFCSWPIRMLATGNSARCVWENPVVIPLKIALCVAASEPPSYSWFLGPTQVNNLNSITFSTAAFAGLTFVTDRPRYSMCSKKLHLAGAVTWPKYYSVLQNLILFSTRYKLNSTNS